MFDHDQAKRDAQATLHIEHTCTVRIHPLPILSHTKGAIRHHVKTIAVALWILLTSWKACETEAREDR